MVFELFFYCVTVEAKNYLMIIDSPVFNLIYFILIAIA